MGNTNYFSGVVKVLENPKEILIKEKFFYILFRVEIPQPKKPRIVSLIFWGNLAREVKKYYRKNDYILVEGYISARNKTNLEFNKRNAKKILITALRVYPVFLPSITTNNKSPKL